MIVIIRLQKTDKFRRSKEPFPVLALVTANLANYTKSHKAGLLHHAAILHQLGITFTKKARSLMRTDINRPKVLPKGVNSVVDGINSFTEGINRISL